MGTVLALAAALCYGGADFLGGSATRRAPVLSVLLLSSVAGVVVVFAAALLAGGVPDAQGVAWGGAAGAIGSVGLMFFYQGLAAGPMNVVAPLSALVSTVLPVGVALATGERFGLLVGGVPEAQGMAWGGAAGAVGSVGLMFFYQGLAAGPMNVVAPLSALVSTVLPVGVALATGERFGLLVYVGAVACLVAIVLISSGGDQTSQHGRVRGISYGLIAGVAFGLFFLLLKYGGESGAIWPAAAARVSGLIVVMIVAGATGAGMAGWRGDQVPVRTALLAGLLDASANVWYLLATRAGLFGVAVVMTSLYPGITILLARVVLGERLQGWQRAGLVLAGLGVVFVTV